MIRLESAVIVEGKYDKITLQNIIDALIIPTDGFAIFKDKDKCRLIKRLAEKNGIIVMTDSDSAGALIRAHIKNIAAGCEITNVYVPCLKGKEKRKTKAGKEGLLGVEGMEKEIILDALKKSGVIGEIQKQRSRKITKTDMFSLGFSGCEAASENRCSFLKHLDLPEGLTPNAMLDIINTFFTYEDFVSEVSKWRLEADKK